MSGGSGETEETLLRLVEALSSAGIQYMLTGSHASSYYGRPRGTQDIDFVITATREQLRAFIAQLRPPSYYVDEQAALAALREHGQFNAIDTETGYKADIIVRKPRPFSEEEFERRVSGEVSGVPLSIATAEDVILSKLEWARLGGSHRQIEDAVGILQARADRLDRDYLEHWVGQLGVEAQWSAALHAAGIER
jgi:hypothetical protein